MSNSSPRRGGNNGLFQKHPKQHRTNKLAAQRAHPKCGSRAVKISKPRYMRSGVEVNRFSSTTNFQKASSWAESGLGVPSVVLCTGGSVSLRFLQIEMFLQSDQSSCPLIHTYSLQRKGNQNFKRSLVADSLMALRQISNTTSRRKDAQLPSLVGTYSLEPFFSVTRCDSDLRRTRAIQR